MEMKLFKGIKSKKITASSINKKIWWRGSYVNLMGKKVIHFMLIKYDGSSVTKKILTG